MTAGKATMGREVGKRMRERLTAKVSGGEAVRLTELLADNFSPSSFDAVKNISLHFSRQAGDR